MADLVRSSTLFKKLLITVLLSLLVVLSIFVRSTTIDKVFEPFDNVAKEYLTSTITKTGITYASVRVVHAAISMIKSSTINPPFSSIAIGELLTPISDLLQNLSDLLLLAIASLGVQRIFLELSQAYVLILFVPAGSLLIMAGVWLNRSNLLKWGVRMLIVGLLLRLLVPAMGTGAYIISSNFLLDKYHRSYDVLMTEESRSLGLIIDENKSLLDKIKSTITNIEQEIGDIKSRIVLLSDSIVSLFSVFLFETLIFPLFSFWVFHLLLVRSIK